MMRPLFKTRPWFMFSKVTDHSDSLDWTRSKTTVTSPLIRFADKRETVTGRVVSINWVKNDSRSEAMVEHTYNNQTRIIPICLDRIPSVGYKLELYYKNGVYEGTCDDVHCIIQSKCEDLRLSREIFLICSLFLICIVYVSSGERTLGPYGPYGPYGLSSGKTCCACSNDSIS